MLITQQAPSKKFISPTRPPKGAASRMSPCGSVQQRTAAMFTTGIAAHNHVPVRRIKCD
jgi:hypothetical protein